MLGKTYCEFFAGIGLVHEALASSGWRCLYANDIDAKKAQMYRHRFGEDSALHLGDVWETDEVRGRIHRAPDLATASFPCTDMSLAGRMKGFQGGGESSAFFGFVEVLRTLDVDKPPLLMLENVVGFLSSRDGGDFRAAVEGLSELGYWIDALVLDARDFVPQSRPRLFVFGFHESLDSPLLLRRTDRFFDDPWLAALDAASGLRPARLRAAMERIELPATGWATLPLKPPRRQRAELEQLLDVDDQQAWWDDPLVQKHVDMMSDDHRAVVERWIRGDSVRVATAYRRIRQGQQRTEVRQDGLAGCLRTPRGGSARQIVLAAGAGNLRMRWMSPREYARLQGADEFPWQVSDSQALFGFGDAVCVPVIRWIDEHVLSRVLASSASRIDAVG